MAGPWWVTLAGLSRDLSGVNTWHADAGELPDTVQTGGVVLTGHGQTFVDVDLAARARVTPATLTLEGAFCVHALPKVLAWVCTCRETNRTRSG